MMPLSSVAATRPQCGRKPQRDRNVAATWLQRGRIVAATWPQRSVAGKLQLMETILHHRTTRAGNAVQARRVAVGRKTPSGPRRQCWPPRRRGRSSGARFFPYARPSCPWHGTPTILRLGFRGASRLWTSNGPSSLQVVQDSFHQQQDRTSRSSRKRPVPRVETGVGWKNGFMRS